MIEDCSSVKDPNVHSHEAGRTLLTEASSGVSPDSTNW